jgi:hypothetical protein
MKSRLLPLEIEHPEVGVPEAYKVEIGRFAKSKDVDANSMAIVASFAETLAGAHPDGSGGIRDNLAVYTALG